MSSPSKARVIEVVRLVPTPGAHARLLRLRAQMVHELRHTYPGLVDAVLSSCDDGTWVDVLSWTSREQAELALAQAEQSVPTFATWSTLVDVLSGDVAEVIA
jgi:hypothetical protein